MSYFSELKRGAINAKRGVCRGYGKVLEKVGEITHITSIEIKGMEIQWDNPVMERKVDVTDSDTSVQDTIDIHKLCEETRQQVVSQIKKYEDDLIDQIEDDINIYIDALSEVFPEDTPLEFQYGLEEGFENDIYNVFSNYIALHISQDSEEFVKILNMSDSVREEKTRKYVEKVISEAKNKLEEKCLDKKIEIFKTMYDNLDSFFENEKNIAKETECNMKELQKHKDDMEYYKEQAIKTVVDVSYMETIRTLTYSNS